MNRLLKVMFFFAAACALFSAPLQAVDFTWNGPSPGSADFNDFSGANWNPPATTPASTDVLKIANGGTAVIAASTLPIDTLYLGQLAGQSGTANVTAGILSITNKLCIGGNLDGVAGGTGSLSLSGTSNLSMFTASGGEFGIGYMSGADGTLSMSDNSTVTATGGFVTGLCGGTGKVFMTGGTITNTGYFYLGDSETVPGGSSGRLEMSGTSKIEVLAGANNWDTFTLGKFDDSHGVVTMTDTASLKLTGTGGVMGLRIGENGHDNGTSSTKGIGEVTMSLHSSINLTAAPMYLGTGALAEGTVTMLDYADITSDGDVVVGYGGTGKLYVKDNATFTSGALAVGYEDNGNACSGLLEISGHGAWTGNGDVTLGYGFGSAQLNVKDDATASIAGLLVLGYYPGSTNDVQLNVSDRAKVTLNNVRVGNSFWDLWEHPGGVVTVSGTTSSVTVSGVLAVGANGSIGVWNQNGGATTTADKVVLGEYGWEWGGVGNGTLNLNGGKFATPGFLVSSLVTDPPSGTTTGTVNFNGGTLVATAGSDDYFAVADSAGAVNLNVLAGGAKIDVNGFNVGITKQLAGVGGLAVLNGNAEVDGVLKLTGPIGYEGATTIAAKATLVIENIPSAATLSTISGAGTLAVSGSTVNAASIQVGTLSIGTPPVAAAIPEPGTLALLALAGLGLLPAWRRK
jgi:fibronectin-binding autotransporter adhesin